MDCSPELFCPGVHSGKTEVDCSALLQGTFPMRIEPTSPTHPAVGGFFLPLVPLGSPFPGSDPTSNDGVSMEDEVQESAVF